MNISDFHKELSALYPTSLSCSWDNDGLMCAIDATAPVKRVLVCLDATDDAVKYAAKNGFDTILTHHPMIFKGLKSITDTTLYGHKALNCLRSGISVISMHTRFDAGKDGVNDVLANTLGLKNVSAFGDEECETLGRIGDITPMAPEEFAAFVRDRLGCVSVNAFLSDKTIKKVAVVGGGAGDFIIPARIAGADAFVVGECQYNSALDAADDGMTIIEAGHYQTEFPACARLAELARTIAGAEAEIYGVKTFKQI